MDYVFYTADYPIASAGSLVLRYAAQAERSRFFKTVIYLPNLIMASAFAMLFFTLFSDGGPINSLLMQIGFIDTPYKFLSNTGSARGLIALMNCPDVVWKHDDPSDGRHDGNRYEPLRGR